MITTFGFLEQSRQGNVHKRSRAESGVLCVEDAWRKSRKLHNQGFYRQHRYTQVHNEIWRHGLPTATGACSNDSRSFQLPSLTVTYQHIAGLKNTLADQISRKQIPLYEQVIPKKLFQQILHQWGPLKIDAFAASHNHKLRRFVQVGTGRIDVVRPALLPHTTTFLLPY
jgi:hypothetical protein